jgi:hypothetical protein
MADAPLEVPPYDPAKDPKVGTQNTVPDTAPLVDGMAPPPGIHTIPTPPAPPPAPHPEVTIDSITFPETPEQKKRAIWLKSLKSTKTTSAYRDDLVAVFKKHAPKNKADVQFAMAAQIVGMLLPVQDPLQAMTVLEADAVLRANIAIGKQASLNQIAKITKLGK